MPLMHHDLHPYPASLPDGLLSDVLALLRGTLPPAKEAAHLAWHCAGFGLSLWDSHPPLKEGCDPCEPPLTREQAAFLVEQHLTAMSAEAKLALPPLPWDKIAVLLLEIVRAVLAR